MEEKEARKLGIELMATADMAYFTTIDERGYPQTRPMANLRNRKEYPTLETFFKGLEDEFGIYLTTGSASPKMAQMELNPKVSVCYCVPAEIHSMMVAGTAEVLTDLETKKALWQPGWEVFWPKGPEGPEFAVLKLRPVFAKGWYKNEGAFEFHFEQ
jgi:general stress protein 26